MLKILFLSGAGISAESGITTLRGSGGLWDNYDIIKVCNAEIFLDNNFMYNRQFVLDFYNHRRRELANKKPNRMHTFTTKTQRICSRNFRVRSSRGEVKKVSGGASSTI